MFLDLRFDDDQFLDGLSLRQIIVQVALVKLKHFFEELKNIPTLDHIIFVF